MKNSLVLSLVAVALLAGCGGGSSGVSGFGGTYNGPNPPTHPVPTTAPASPAPSPSPGAVLATATIQGGTAFVNAADHAVYVFSGDTVADKSACTGSCITIWPPVAPPSGVKLNAPWSSFTRTDGNGQQLAYKGKPLYTFISDSQAFVATGNDLQGFAIARP